MIRHWKDVLQEHITSINSKVSSHGLKIDKIRHQVSGQAILCDN